MEENDDFIVRKLGPYSPQQNTLENIWSKINAAVKRGMRVPEAHPPAVGKQRLQYVEGLIDTAMCVITPWDIGRACQHSQGFFQAAVNLEGMGVGL